MNNTKEEIPRCFTPSEFAVAETSLHHFSDASDVGYGQCSFLRFTSIDGQVHCCLVSGKSRVVPLKSSVSLPRLDLLAATLSDTSVLSPN